MIKIEDVTYGYDPANPLMCNVSFDIEKNDILAIVGDNGAGKTTLLKIIAGHLPVVSGKINYHVENVRVAYVPANLNYFLLPWYRVHQNISFFKTNGKTLKNTDCSTIGEIKKYLPNIGDDFSNNYIYSLSSGEKAVVAFVCALHSNPDLIILDEIFSNTTKDVSYRLIEGIKKELNIPIVFTSHTSDYVDRLNNKIVSVMGYK